MTIIAEKYSVKITNIEYETDSNNAKNAKEKVQNLIAEMIYNQIKQKKT